MTTPTAAPSASRNARLADGLMLLGLLLALAWIYRRLVCGWMLAGGDLATYFYPYWSAAARTFQEGRLPLWNPYLFAGAPLLANSQVGTFYPLNAPLWWLSGPELAGAARTLHLSVLLHLALAGVNACLLARAQGLSRPGAALVGLLYAGSGYLGVQVEHLNQLQGLAWLPLTFLPWREGRPRALSLLALGLILLAGHTQTAFIAAVGLSFYHLVVGWLQQPPASRRQLRAQLPLLLALSPFALAGLLAAVQLLPTTELARLSIRAGGLPWREAVSFSVAPWTLHRALLPPYLLPPLLPEGVAYLGLIGMLLAAYGALRALRRREAVPLAVLALGIWGLFLALGGYNPFYLLAARLGVPGVVHFRAPARFLALYVLAGALLAGQGLSALLQGTPVSVKRGWPRPDPRFAGIGLAVLALAELLLSAERLPHAAATAPRAYTSLRPATAHLVAAARAAESAGQPAGRFLSISQTLFEPGDEPEIEAVYGGTLSPASLWNYMVAAKQREVLAPNLSLAFRVPALDGYDGGLLPLRTYAAFSRLLLPEGTLDGRLRENLQGIPAARWLELLDVQRLITDKTGDTWSDGIFYDRQFQPVLAPGARFTPAWLPPDFAADELRLFYQGQGEVELTLEDGRQERLPLSPVPQAADAPARLHWAAAGIPHAVTLRAADPGLTLTGMTLVDTRSGAFFPLVLSDRFRLAHSGDVKIYETVAPFSRARLIHRAAPAASDEDALARMADPAFDPAAEIVLADCPAAPEGLAAVPPAEHPAADGVRIRNYGDTRIDLEVDAAAAGYLLLKDAWYPGWEAKLTPVAGTGPGTRLPICRADLWLRAVPIPAGRWTLTVTYVPGLLIPGIGVSLLGVLLWAGYAIIEKRGAFPSLRRQ